MSSKRLCLVLSTLGALALTAETGSGLELPLLGGKVGAPTSSTLRLPLLSGPSVRSQPAAQGASSQCNSDASGVVVSGSGLLGLEANLQSVAFPPGGATTFLDTATLPIPLPIPLQAQVLGSSAENCSAESKVAHVSLDVIGLVSVRADVAQARASANPCAAEAHVENLSVSALGIPLPIPDVIPPNLVLPLGPLGSLVVNEQSCSATNAVANALHLNLLVGLPPIGESIDVTVSHATASP